MKPHRRKKTPPRREQESQDHANEAEATPPSEAVPQEAPALDPDPATYQAPAEPYVDPGDMQYDPGQALAEESTSPYAETDPAQPYVDPGQQAVDPSYQAYVEPPAEPYVDPAQAGYVDPNQAYSTPPPPPPADPSPDAGIYDEAPVTSSPKAHPRKKIAKKKSVRRAPAARPVTTGARPGGYTRPAPSSGGGVSVMTVFLSLCAVVMLAIVAFVVLPKNLKTIAGYPATPTVSGESRNLLDEGQKLMINRDGELSLTEEQVNTYLNERLKGKQEGMMAILVKFKGVYIDFTPGFAEVFVERELLGIPLTMSAKIKGERFRRQVLYKPAGWSIGKIEFKSRNIKPVIEMFTRLRESMQDEYQVLKMMTDVRFEEDRLVLDPS